MFGDKEWYFFSSRDRKYPNGVRPNRAAASGYWKATGTDKPIVASRGNENIGFKKALVFYKGKPPKGVKTNWIMHEYRLSEAKNKTNLRPVKLKDSPMRLDDWVLCRIYQKSSHLQEDSNGIESPISNTHNSTQENDLMMHKSFSLSELLNEADFSLLSRLHETPTELEMAPVLDKASFGYTNLNHPFINMHPFSETESSSVSITENSLKRRRIGEEGPNYYPASKKINNNSWVYTNFPNQFDSQNFYSQHLLLNPQYGDAV
ncbi:uncharacterized protein A4U43_C02F18500 [Asparagus officinalis]|uniref:NAC domain-containing protein n=2 Tax=Asparagus officinalis TaxID=4686 RepID=A0A5P1FJX0_ASPOF|nr:uncharacterized protein A4U43_C02F18500 [Asparagus officinalis]